MRRIGLLPILLLWGAGCSDQKQIGAAEPFRVNAFNVGDPTPEFIKGPLPGRPPLDGGANAPSTPDGGVGPPELAVFSVPSKANAGQSGVPINGETKNAVSVGLELDVGTGYWVFPVQGVNVATNNPEWEVSCDFDKSVTAGYHTLRAVAFDQNGNPGRQSAARTCIEGLTPDNFNACVPGTNPPNAVIALTWDTAVDLDLQVLLPDGRLIDSKHPLITRPDDAGALPKNPDGINRDSNPSCAIDGINAEDLVWNVTTPRGPYGIYVNLFSACNQQVVHFMVTVYKSIPNKDGSGNHLAQQWQQGGELLALSANGGTQRGLYVNTFTFK